MADRRIEVNPGEFMLIADPTILVREYESVLGDTMVIGSSEHQPAYLITFSGKVNNKDEHQTITVALPLQAAWELCGDIINGMELFMKANGQ